MSHLNGKRFELYTYDGLGGHDNMLNGSNLADLLVGSNGDDKIVAKGGVDFVFGDGPLVIDSYYGNYVGVRVLSDEEITLGNDVINGGTGPNEQLASNGIFEWAYFGDILSGTHSTRWHCQGASSTLATTSS